MEKQTGRKIKVLQFDHVGEYIDRFLQFSQNSSIGIQFTVGKYWVAKEMNRPLLKKVQYLLSNAQLDKLFWAEPLEYASHLINRLSSNVIRGKTSLNIWLGEVTQDYDFLQVFGCPAYFSVKDDKLNPRVKKFVFLAFKKNLKGYKLWDSENKKIVLSRYVIFDDTFVDTLKKTRFLTGRNNV